MLLKRISAILISVLMCLPLCFPINASAENEFVRGIDVSVHQGDVDFEKVKQSGIDFVILRCGTTKGKDANFEDNYLKAKAAGLGVGCYYYTYAESIEDVENDAKNVLSWIEGKKLEYPVYFDIESNSSTLGATDMATEMCFTFLDMLAQNGWYCGIYCNEDWLNSYLDRDLIESSTEIWYARWTASGEPDRDYSMYGMWQYSESGTCDGIKGPVDLDICYKDYPQIIKSGGYNGFSKEEDDFYLSENSSFYLKDGYLYGARQGMTVKELIDEAGFNCQVEAVEVSDTSMAATGTVIKKLDGKVSCTVVLKGDTNGDGILSSVDFMRARGHFLGQYTLDGAFYAAADADGNSLISSTDCVKIRSHYLGLTDMYE